MYYNNTTSELTYGPPTANLPISQVAYQGSTGLTGSSNLTIDASGIVTAGPYVDYNNTLYTTYSNPLTTSFADSTLDTIGASWTQTGTTSFVFDASGIYIDRFGSDPGPVATMTNSSAINSTINLSLRPGQPYMAAKTSLSIRLYNITNTRYYEMTYKQFAGDTSGHIIITDSSGGTILKDTNVYLSSAYTTFRPVQINRTSTSIEFFDNGVSYYTASGLTNIGTRIEITGTNTGNSYFQRDKPSIANLTFTSLLSRPAALSLMSGGDLLPNMPNIYNIGSTAFRFNNIYSDNMNIRALQSQAVANYMTYNTSSGNIGYTSVGTNAQFIYNDGVKLTGTDTLTINSGILTAGTYVSNAQVITTVYANGLIHDPSSAVVPDPSSNDISGTLTATGTGFRFDPSGLVIGVGGNVTSTFDCSGVLGDNLVDITLKPGSSQTNNAEAYFRFFRTNGTYYQLRYSWAGDVLAGATVTLTLTDSSGGSTIYTRTYPGSEWLLYTHKFEFKRTRIGLTISDTRIGLDTTAVVVTSLVDNTLGSKFLFYEARNGTYGEDMIYTNFNVSRYTGFPQTSALAVGGDLVPNMSNAYYLGNINYPFSTAYISTIVGTGGTTGGVLNVTGNGVFSGSVSATSFPTSSDQRIKDNVVSLDSSSSLVTVNQLNPVQFTYRTQFNDTANIPGFISQEVDSILPGSTTTGTGFVANIKRFMPCKLEQEIDDVNKYYSYSIDISELGLQYPINLCIRANNMPIRINATYHINYFTFTELISQVYVYGTEVQDFMYLSYDHIYTLNVSATQELTKRLDAQAVLIQTLQDRISTLENK